MVMTYQEARAFIDQSNQYGSKLGLESITELLSRLHNPQDKLKIIHVAGTNGKGSTTAFLSSILAAGGYKVGRYISPAVFSYRERVQITVRSGEALETEYISREGVSSTIAMIQAACEQMVQDGYSHPTTFEIETAMAMLYLAQEKVDFAVVEVGLGGRLDATNVIKQPVCCVISSISMDHMQYLGDTLAKITSEKAGIIKSGVPVISCNRKTEVVQVLRKVADEKAAPLTLIDDSRAELISTVPEGTTFRYGEETYRIKLLGLHQISNALLAIATAEVLKQRGYRIRENSIKEGLQLARWRGRFEVIAKEPYLIIDGAHNEDAANRLTDAIRMYFRGKRVIYVMGVFADKDYRQILRITAPLAELIITLTPDNSRALSSDCLALEAKKYCSAVMDAKTAEQALRIAYQEANKEDVIIAFGSLSFLGELIAHIPGEH
jgi:dihydrofolate synthase/folylpolyglutamate synthase